VAAISKFLFLSAVTAVGRSATVEPEAATSAN